MVVRMVEKTFKAIGGQGAVGIDKEYQFGNRLPDTMVTGRGNAQRLLPKAGNVELIAQFIDRCRNVATAPIVDDYDLDGIP
jgi:hypothetical protein